MSYADWPVPISTPFMPLPLPPFPWPLLIGSGSLLRPPFFIYFHPPLLLSFVLFRPAVPYRCVGSHGRSRTGLGRPVSWPHGATAGSRGTRRGCSSGSRSSSSVRVGGERGMGCSRGGVLRRTARREAALPPVGRRDCRFAGQAQAYARGTVGGRARPRRCRLVSPFLPRRCAVVRIFACQRQLVRALRLVTPCIFLSNNTSASVPSLCDACAPSSKVPYEHMHL